MRKIICFAMVCLLMLTQVVFIASASSETALGSGDRDVLFSNGYKGFCLDSTLKSAASGDSFIPTDTSAALSNKDNGDISQMLKVLFTQCFDDLFVSSEMTYYTIPFNQENYVKYVEMMYKYTNTFSTFTKE